jgi:hypothetical protein
MKRAGILFLFLAITLSANAQMWIEVGAKGQYGFKGFYNDNIINDRDHEYKISSGYSYGGLVNINFADRHGFIIEGLLSENVQKFNYELGGSLQTASEVSWTTLDGYLMYRAYNNTAYLEIGPKISMVRSIDQSPNPLNIWDIPKQYNEQYWSAAIGFGGMILGSEFFTLKMGLRFEYALGDLVNETGQDNRFPAYYVNYEDYKASHPFSATLNLELNFAIGAVARAQCGRRSFIFGSGY